MQKAIYDETIRRNSNYNFMIASQILHYYQETL